MRREAEHGQNTVTTGRNPPVQKEGSNWLKVRKHLCQINKKQDIFHESINNISVQLKMAQRSVIYLFIYFLQFLPQ